MNVVERSAARTPQAVAEPSDSAPAAAPAEGLPEEPTGAPRKTKLRPLAALVPYISRYRGRAIAAVCALVVASLATLAVPIAVRRMIDFGFTEEGARLINSYFSVMIAVAGLLGLASALRFYLVTTLGERIVADLRSEVFAHLTSLSAAYFDKAKTGEMVSRLTADTTQIKAAVGSSVSVALRNLVLFLGASAMMVYTSPRLSAFVLAAIPVIVLPLYGFGRAVRHRSRQAQDALADASAYVSELISAIRVLQAFTNEALAIGRFRAAVERAFETAVMSTRSRAILTAIAIFLVFGSVVVVLWIGAQDVMAGTISPGTLGQFLLFAALAAGGLGELSQVGAEVAAASGAAERLFEILALKPSIERPAHPIALPVPGRGEVELAGVSFAYPARPGVRVLDGISLGVRRGEKVALVGPSGAGKSTIFHLLLRFYDPAAGTIRLDGVAIKEADPFALRQRIALVPQEPVVFGASIEENIRFGRPQASDAEVAKAAELALASEFIARLPQGFATPVGERGVTLSGGQRQRLAIARAILRDAPLLLLDEATSSLDAESETLVKEALEHLMAERTTLVIAHRLATVQSCDRILVMEAGRIVEEGTHDQLVAGGGLYARLAKLQFQNL
jgi:ATP-binding cassette, subfamily B, bacterial